ncbi:MAG TPA: hypothetical protein DIS76_06655, partial [Rhodospirillaceae bacterium]|nr:hypothetical protein [Rhodospirillaceae bacterium]
DAVISGGFNNYSILHSVEGKGDRGFRQAEGFHVEESNIMFLCICAPDRLSELADIVRPYLHRYGGLCWSEDVTVL